MNARRVCDACSVRRVRCDGRDPCARCTASSLRCQRLRSRKKMGPKSVRTKTMDRMASLGIRPTSPSPEQLEHNAPGAPNAAPWAELDSFNPTVPFSVMRPYLEISHNKMYQVWPVFDIHMLSSTLTETPNDPEANMLALSICTATILQLQLMVEGSGMAAPQTCIEQIEEMRSRTMYRRRPTLDSLLTSFFLHICYLHMNQQSVSTLLLREAITMAHLLELHQPSHYAASGHNTVQTHLRVLWLLFVTERAHARQYDLPCTLTIPSTLPALQNEDSLSAFTSLCSMFACYDGASQAGNMAEVETRLQMIPVTARSYNSIQQADLTVTREWMRLLLWKDAVSSQAMTMTAETLGAFDSILYPVQVARDLLASTAPLSIDALEAHGPGMGLKLFTLATSLADVITCMPTHAAIVAEWHAMDCLVQISNTLHRFRGGTSEAIMSILRERFTEIGLNHTLPAPGMIEQRGTPASDESENSETAVPSSLDSCSRIIELGENGYG